MQVGCLGDKDVVLKAKQSLSEPNKYIYTHTYIYDGPFLPFSLMKNLHFTGQKVAIKAWVHL